MFDYRRIVKNQELRLKLEYLLRFIPTIPYLKLVYRVKTGKKLNLKNPVGFNEKEQWLKLHDIHPEYTQLVDKYEVRKFVRDKIGANHLFPLLGVWDKFEDICFANLPNEFVLKCTHDSGSVKIIRDKTEIDKKSLQKFFRGRQRINPYAFGREYPYRKVKPRIIAEQFMSTPDGKAPNDYKFFCFNGEPYIMFVATERETDTKFDFFDMQFNHLPIVNIHPNSDKPIDKPSCFDEMVELSRKLSAGMKFVRIDLYEIDGRVYFGEFTFFHGGGFWLFEPDDWEKRLGNLITCEE